MKKILLIILVLTILLMPVFGDNHFSDVASDKWYSSWVETIYSLKITSGYPDGTFKPDNQLKRIELLSFTMKSLNHEIQVAEGYWGQNILDKAVEENIIDIDDLMYKDPEGLISRQETARVIYNAYLKEETTFNADEKQQVMLLVKDFDQVNEKYKQGVIGMIASGIVEGYADGSFKPNNNLTRAEAAVFISRLAMPEKRKQVNLAMGVFEYNTTSVTAESFKVHYLPEHQDIYNMLTLIDVIENEDVDNGFALIMGENSESYHGVNLYKNMEDFDYAPYYLTHEYQRWALTFRKSPPQEKFTGWIEVLGWRKLDQWEHESVLKALFEYLFDDDSEFVWNKFVEISKSEEWIDGFDYIGLHNGRDVKISGSGTGFCMYVTRKTDAMPVNILLYK